MKRITFLSIILVSILLGIGASRVGSKHDFPLSCHFQTKQERAYKDGIISLEANYSLIKITKDKGEFSVEGRVKGEGFTYHMHRTLHFNINQIDDNGLYHLTFNEVIRKKDDNMPDSFFELQHPSTSSSTLMTVEKVNANAYLLNLPYTPLAICVSL
jgi:hypothetical protein